MTLTDHNYVEGLTKQNAREYLGSLIDIEIQALGIHKEIIYDVEIKEVDGVEILDTISSKEVEVVCALDEFIDSTKMLRVNAAFERVQALRREARDDLRSQKEDYRNRRLRINALRNERKKLGR